MLNFKCKCGNEIFKVNRKQDMVQCTCKARYKFNRALGLWYKFKMPVKQKVKEFVAVAYENVMEKIVSEAESMGQWMKHHGIIREKPIDKFKKAKERVALPGTVRIDRKTDLKKKHIEKKWKRAIFLLEASGYYFFDKNIHFGKLRGRDAAQACHSDLKVIGIKTRLRFTSNRSAMLEMVW